MKPLFSIQYDESTQAINMTEVRYGETLNWSAKQYDVELLCSLIAVIDIKLGATSLEDTRKAKIINDLLIVLDKHSEHLNIL